jgi:hypothetical protein
VSDGIKLAGFAGLASIALGIVALPADQMWTFPGAEATAGEVAAFARENRPELFVAMVLNTIAVGLWLVFGAGVWLRMRQVADDESILPACFMAGLVGFVTLLLTGFTAFLLLVYRAPEAPDSRLLYDLSFALLAMSGIPTALALGSYAALTLQSGSLPRWTALVATAAALAHLLLLASLLVKNGFFSLEGGVTIAIPATLFAWIAATSWVMLAEGRSVGPKSTI